MTVRMDLTVVTGCWTLIASSRVRRRMGHFRRGTVATATVWTGPRCRHTAVAVSAAIKRTVRRSLFKILFRDLRTMMRFSGPEKTQIYISDKSKEIPLQNV